MKYTTLTQVLKEENSHYVIAEEHFTSILLYFCAHQLRLFLMKKMENITCTTQLNWINGMKHILKLLHR